MNHLFKTLKYSKISFIKVFQFNKPIVLLSLAVYIFNSIQSNINIYLTGMLVNQFQSQSIRIVIQTIMVIAGLQIFKLILETFSRYKNLQLSINFAQRSQADLIHIVAQTELLDKEHPKFKSDFLYWSYASGQYYNSYLGTIQLTQQIITSILGFYLLSSSFILLGLMAVIIGIVRGVVELSFVRHRVLLNQEIQKKTREHYYYFFLLTETQHQKELMLNRLVNHFMKSWEAAKKKVNMLELKLEKLNINRYRVGQLISTLNYAVILIIIAVLIANQHLTIGDYVTITMALSMTENNIAALFQGLSNLMESANHIEQLENNKELVERQSISTQEAGLNPFSFHKEIKVSDLTFYYPNREKPALSHISLCIPKGKKIAIVGANGSGKSTLIKVLLGLYRVPPHAVFIDDLGIEQINREDMWQKMSAIFQDFIKYTTDVRENVAVGNIGEFHNSERIERILDSLALLTEFPKGIDTKLGDLDDTSVNLSGGQWQKLALSRIFIRDKAEVIVLDEPTSALDPTSEVNLMNQILTHCYDKTVLLISHRIGIARQADHIIVMQDGKIVEEGTHQELIIGTGAYQMMWEQQREWYE
ncbi:Lipid A export ATP-binding/permease protein MsbA [Paenibacillus polymyxa E681]|nr:multidrug ABC transporter [Paenibacillus polymyxa E681]QNV55052.1 Lipid A export ATP-binding/permease protein MsbA [Paenibacillus polymyxa E681]QNV59889.1 Lipid A export ATP-binding/permease protein MsbA [Paenibacillus polymyxa E681]